MSGKIDEILIVGGGTAGWLTAAYLARRLGSDKPDGVKITLIESSEIGIIGVGEGTIPTIQTTMRTIGVDEAAFLRGADAAFKQGIRFVDWEKQPSAAGRRRHYYHSFSRPHELPGGFDLTPYWLLGVAGDVQLSEAVTLQDAVCEAGRGPKLIDDPQYASPLAYAYHFDAGKLAAFLKQVGKQLGVSHLLGNVEDVRLDEDGAIAAVKTREHGELTAGLYIDCTGFAAALIEKALKVPFISDADTLFVDRALAMQVPYDDPETPVATTTVSTAHEAGWTWDIALPDRRGIGYVYSSAHTGDDRAEEILRGYIGPSGDRFTPRSLKLRIGHREKHWVKNCVAIGLSAGFLEPLESTGIMMIEAAAWMIGRLFPRDGRMEETAKLFNQAMDERFQGAVDFLKLHYCLSKRPEPFWVDNTRASGIPDTLQSKLDMWRQRPPDSFDFGTVHDCFEVFNYQYVLYGMGFETDLKPNRAAYPYLDQAAREFARIRETQKRAVAGLPDHRKLLEEVYRTGFRSPPPTSRLGVAPLGGA